jgi:hypothetical protein
MATFQVRACLWLLASITFYTSELRADDYPLPRGFPNYYRAENVYDWAINCKVVAALPTLTATLPTDVGLQFVFEWNTAVQQSAQLYKNKTGSTTFDLCVRPPGATFAYLPGDVGISPDIDLHSPFRATVRFPTPIRVTAGDTDFEIYGSCDGCDSSNGEAQPPSNQYATWRIFGKIRCNVSGGVLQCAVVDLNVDDKPGWEAPGSGAQHPKEFISNHSTQASWYPQRQVPRPTFFGLKAPCGVETCNSSAPCCLHVGRDVCGNTPRCECRHRTLHRSCRFRRRRN